MTKKQEKMIKELHREAESCEYLLRMLLDKANAMKVKIEDSFDENPPADEDEKDYIDGVVESIDNFIDTNLTSMLSVIDALDIEDNK